MSTQHTPGPWEIDFGYNRIIHFIGPCVPDQYAGSAWLEVTEADARLIAAAPELLEFAEEVRRTGDTRLASMAIAVIAKAIGEAE